MDDADPADEQPADPEPADAHHEDRTAFGVAREDVAQPGDQPSRDRSGQIPHRRRRVRGGLIGRRL